MSKRITLIICILVMGIFLLSPIANANNTQEHIPFELSQDEVYVFDVKEITDDTELLKRAAEGINEGPANIKTDVAVLNKENKIVASDELKTYSTVQRLKTKKNIKTGELTHLYKAVIYGLVPTAHLEECLKQNYENRTEIQGSATDPKERIDPSMTIKVRNVIYYEYKTCYLGSSVGWQDVYKFTKVTGSWTKLGSISWGMRNGLLSWGQQGRRYMDCVDRGIYLYGSNAQIDYPDSGRVYDINCDTDGYYMSNHTSACCNTSQMSVELFRDSQVMEYLLINTLND